MGGKKEFFLIYLTLLIPPFHNMEMYSLHEGEDIKRGAKPLLNTPS